MLNSNDKRFRRLIRKFGFKIRKISFRPDILSVQYGNKHLMVIPRTIRPLPDPEHKDIAGHIFPDYFDLEKTAQYKNILVKRSNLMETSWYEERLSQN